MTPSYVDYTVGRWRPAPEAPGLYRCTWVDGPDASPCDEELAYPIARLDADEWDGDALCLAHLCSVDLDVEESVHVIGEDPT